jgi:hypothetical protein
MPGEQERLSIIIEAVERAKKAIDETIAGINRVNSATTKQQGVFTRVNTLIEQNARLYLSLNIAAGAAAGAVGLLVRNSIKNADSLHRQAQALETTVEVLDGLQFAAALADVEIGQLSLGLHQMGRSLAEAKDQGSEAAKIFRDLKIDPSTLTNSVDGLLALADAFERTTGANEKARISQALLSRGGREFVAFLNQGSEAIRNQIAEGQRLGGTTSELGKQADKFGDDMVRVRQILKGAGNEIATSLLPTLQAGQKLFIENAEAVKILIKIVGGLAAAFLAASAAQKFLAATGKFGQYSLVLTGIVTVLETGIEGWKLWKARQDEALATQNLERFLAVQREGLKDQINTARALGQITEEQAIRAKNALEANKGNVDAQRRAQSATKTLLREGQGLAPIVKGGKEKLTTTADPKVARDAATAVAQAQLEASVEGQKTSLELQEIALQTSLDRRLITVEEFEKKRRDLTNQSFELELKAIDDQTRLRKEALEEQLKAATDPTDQIKLQSEIAVTEQKSFQQRAALVGQFEQRRATESQQGVKLEEEQQATKLQNEAALADVKERESERVFSGNQTRANLNAQAEAGIASIEAQARIQAATATDDELLVIAADTAEKKRSVEARRVEALKTIRAKEIEGAKTTFDNIAVLAESFGAQGVAIYKAAATASALISTYQGATAAFAAMAGIPYVGPVLGVIAAAAAVAAGLANIAKINGVSFAEGGLVPGSPSTRDNRVATVATGEYIFDSRSVSKVGPAFMASLHGAIQRGEFFSRGGLVPRPVMGSSFQGGGLVGRGGAGTLQDAQELGVNVAFVESRNQMREFIRRDGTSILISQLQARGNQVVS